jgi:hypothetical protein
MLPAVRQQGGHETGAGADFQHLLVVLDFQLLQQPRFDLGLEHAGAGRIALQQRQLRVHEGPGPNRRRREVLPAHGRQQGQHGLIEHLPGADLLLDHVEAGDFGVHGLYLARYMKRVRSDSRR